MVALPTTDLLFNNVIRSVYHLKNPYWLSTNLQKE